MAVLSKKGLSGVKCSAELGVSPERLIALVNEGRVPRRPDGKYDLDAVKAAFLASTDPAQRSKIAGSAGTGESGFHAHRTEHERLKVELLRIELEQTERRLVDAEQIRIGLGGLVLAIRDRFLALANDVADEFAVESDPAVIRASLANRTHDILTELSKWKPEATTTPA